MRGRLLSFLLISDYYTDHCAMYPTGPRITITVVILLSVMCIQFSVSCRNTTSILWSSPHQREVEEGEETSFQGRGFNEVRCA